MQTLQPTIARNSHPVRSPQRPFRTALFCAMLALSLAGCGQGTSGAVAAPNTAGAALPATVIEVAPQRVPIEVEAVGQVEGSKEVEVRARVAGILLKRSYKEGDVVSAGAPMFRIDPAPFEIALVQARAQLAQEQARNDQARREATRLTRLAAEKAISQRESDDAGSSLKLSDAALQAAQARVREAELNLSYTTVTAPVSGAAGRAVRSEGSLVSPGADSLLTAINQLDPIWVRFSLSESDLEKLPQKRLVSDAPVEVRLTLPDGMRYPGKGRVNFAAMQIDPRLGTQQLRAQFDNEKRQLLPGQFVRVQLVAGYRDKVFLVPQTAVMQAEQGRFVFVLDKDSKVATRPVKTGDWVGSDWIILSGLAAGDRVIVDNLLKLRPGAVVSPQAAAKPANADSAPAR